MAVILKLKVLGNYESFRRTTKSLNDFFIKVSFVKQVLEVKKSPLFCLSQKKKRKERLSPFLR